MRFREAEPAAEVEATPTSVGGGGGSVASLADERVVLRDMSNCLWIMCWFAFFFEISTKKSIRRKKKMPNVHKKKDEGKVKKVLIKLIPDLFVEKKEKKTKREMGS